MKVKILFLTFMLACFLVLPVNAQESELEVTFGIVVKVSDDQIIIMEYDFEEDLEKEIVYIIDSQTEYEDAESYADIDPGDPVEILYVDEGDRKIARLITKETIPEDDEELDWLKDIPELDEHNSEI